MKLSGKTAIVTGAGKGIGNAIARRFLREGAQVMLAEFDEASASAAAEDMASLGEVDHVVCDVGERLDVHNLTAATLDRFGEIDILVNNAGIVHGGDFLDISEADFDEVLRVNLKGPFLCSQAVAKHMIAQVDGGKTPGSIINMSSVAAVLGLKEQVPYTVAKGGIRQLTTVLAQYLAPWGIRVNAIGPGTIETDMMEEANDEMAKRDLLMRTPMGRFGEPQEIAGIAAFLASSDASYITGQTVYADGGRLGLNLTVDLKEN